MRYLFIQFIRKPNGQIDEAVSMSRRVKLTDQQLMNVILDYAEKNTDWDRMNDYYKKIYPNLIGQLEKEAHITAKAK